MANGYKARDIAVHICLYLFLTLAALPGARAQSSSTEFDLDVVNALDDASSGLTRIDIYTRISFAHLQFINAGSHFSASYEVTVYLYRLDDRDRKLDLVKNRSWREEVSTPRYDLTNSVENYDRAVQSLAVPPGKYLLEIRLEDQSTGKVYRQERPVLVRDLNTQVAISDLILLDAYDAGTNSIAPRVSNQLSTDQTSIRIFYELYAASPNRVRITHEIIRMPHRSGFPSMRSIFGLDNDSDEGEITYTKVEATPLKIGQSQRVVELPSSDLGAGDYRLRVRIQSEAGETLDVTDKVFSVHWAGVDAIVREIDDAIEQLEYIAKSKDLRYMRAGRSKEERLARFHEFWAKRDPTPGTERNERMEEYYFRIAFANRNFGDLKQGWKTDRGYVAIHFGEPDRIDRRENQADGKPLEIWFYDRIRRQFIFIDKTGLGDFELMIPIWDERTHIR